MTKIHNKRMDKNEMIKYHVNTDFRLIFVLNISLWNSFYIKIQLLLIPFQV